MIKQIVYAFLSVILLVMYLELALVLLVITFFLPDIFNYLHMPLEGAIALLILNVLILLWVLGKIQKNVSRIDWEPFRSNNLTYEITNPPNGTDSSINVTFIATYELMGRLHERKVAIVKNRVYKEKIEQLLDTKLVKNPMQAILYKKSRSDSTEVIYRNTFSITNVLLVALFVPINIGLIFSSLILYGQATIQANFTQTQLLNELQHGIVIYVYEASALLLGLYIIYIFRGIRKSGLRGFRTYPMLYDVTRGLEEDFLLSLYRMSDICSNCGEIIEIREKYCSGCGQIVPKRKFYHLYDEPKPEDEESAMVLTQPDIFDH